MKTPYRGGCLVLLFVALWALPAGADLTEDRAQAEAVFKDGIKAYKEGRYEDAINLYQKASTLAPSASGPYREMGKAYEALGKKEEAKKAYLDYLKIAPASSDTEEIKARYLALGGQLPDAAPAVSGGAAGGAAALAAPAPSPAPVAEPPKHRTALWIGLGIGGALIIGAGTAIAIDAITKGGGGGGDDDGGKNQGQGKMSPFTISF